MKQILWVLLVVLGLAAALALWFFKFSGKAARKAAVKAYNRAGGTSKSNMVDYEVKLVGVTFANRQELIKNLPKDATLVLKMVEGYVADGKDYPNAMGVYTAGADGVLVHLGWIPDSSGPNRSSIAKMFRDKIRKGKDPVITGWHRVGGHVGAPNWGLHIHVRNPR